MFSLQQFQHKNPNAGEKWVAKKEQTLRPQATVQSPSLVSGVQQAFDRRPNRPWPGYDLMGGMLRVLPRMLGLGIPSTAVVNGYAAVGGTVLSAEQQAHLNARSKRPLGSTFISREMFQTSATSFEVWARLGIAIQMQVTQQTSNMLPIRMSLSEEAGLWGIVVSS